MMNAVVRAGLRQALEAARLPTADAWRRALQATGFSPLSSAEVYDRCAAFTGALIDALLAEPFDPGAGRAIGGAVAKLHFIHPDALAQTQHILGDRLLAELDRADADDLRQRLRPLLAEVSAGYFAEARTILLEEQETIRSAWAEESRRAQATIAQLNAELEQRVRDRTAALSAEVEERRRAEAALRDSEERYRGLVELSPEPIAVYADGKLVYVNPAGAQLAGAASPGELVGRPVLDFVPADAQPTIRPGLDAGPQPGQPPLLETQVVSLDGRRINVELVAIPTTYEGEPAVQVVIRDISQRQRAAQAQRLLAEAGAALASSLDYVATMERVAHVAVPAFADWCIVDLLGNDDDAPTAAVAHVQPELEARLLALRRTFSVTPDGAAPAARALGSGQAVLMAAMPEVDAYASEDAEHYRQILALGTKSGIAVPLTARGRTLGVITFARTRPGHAFDAADLDLAEELARRCALALDNARLYLDAQRAIHARDEFLSVAAHELKTPLTSLLGFAQLTLHQVEQRGTVPTERLLRSMQRITTQSKKLTNLVEQLLDISRLETGRLQLALADVDVHELVADIVQMAQEQTDRHTITVSGLATAPARIDPLRFEQVVTNLVGNAVKYSPHGAIEVELASAGPALLLLSVRDHGPGVAPEDRAKIFTPFFRAEEQRHVSGLGLGLYLCRQLVELHGGRIEAHYPDDGGLRMVVTLPTQPPALGAAETDAADNAAAPASLA